MLLLFFSKHTFADCGQRILFLTSSVCRTCFQNTSGFCRCSFSYFSDVGFYDEDAGKVFFYWLLHEGLVCAPSIAARWNSAPPLLCLLNLAAGFLQSNGGFWFSDQYMSSPLWEFSWSSRSHLDLHSCPKLPSLNYISHCGNCKLTTLCCLVAFLCIVDVNIFHYSLTQLFRGSHCCWVFTQDLMSQSICKALTLASADIS